MSEYVIATDEKGRRWAVGPVMARHLEQLRDAIAGHGWMVEGTATQLSVYAFRAAAGRRRDGGGRR